MSRWVAGVVLTLLIANGCGADSATTLPLVVPPDRPDTLDGAPIPTTVDQAIDALSRGLSAADVAAMRSLNEDDAVASTHDIALRLQHRWALDRDGALRRVLAAAGFDDPGDMSDAVLRSFWRRLHDRPLDLLGQAREARAVRAGDRPDWRWVLFTGPMAMTLLDQCGRPVPAPTGTWNPDASTLRHVDQVLKPALQTALDQYARPGVERLNATDYYRQFAGLLVDGRRLIYINGFHREDLSVGQTTSRPERAGEWRTAAVSVCDGGLWFFGAEYDLATDRVGPIRFNGLIAR